MKNFKDEDGREWVISLNIGKAKKLRDVLGVNLFTTGGDNGNLPDGKVLSAIDYDDISLMEIVACLMSEQILANDMTEAEFLETASAQTVKNARAAFGEEFVNFSRQSGRDTLATMMENQMKVGEMVREKIASHFSGTNAEQIATDIFTRLLESLALPQTV